MSTLVEVQDETEVAVHADLGPQQPASVVLSILSATIDLFEFSAQLDQLTSAVVAITDSVEAAEGRVVAREEMVRRALAQLQVFNPRDIEGVIEAIEGEYVSQGRIRGAAASAILTSTRFGSSTDLKDDYSGSVRIRFASYTNPLELVLLVSGYATVKGIVWCIQRYQEIRKTSLEIQELEAKRADRTDQDRQRDAVLSNQDPRVEPDVAIILSVTQVALGAELSGEAAQSEFIKRQAQNLQRLPPDTEAEIRQ